MTEEADWSEFPARVLEPTTPLHRIHRVSRSAPYFGASGLHRFDPPTTHPNEFGVCYLGLEPLTAFVEVFGRVRPVQRSEIESRRLSTARVINHLRLADLTKRTVLGRFGVTAAHSTGTDYGPAQSLSLRLHTAGFDGLVYRVRHDPELQLEVIALFGAPEAASHAAIKWDRPSPIPGSLIQLGQQFGIDVLRKLVLL